MRMEGGRVCLQEGVETAAVGSHLTGKAFFFFGKFAKYFTGITF